VVALPYRRIAQSGVLGLARGFSRPVVVTDVLPNAGAIQRSHGRVVPMDDDRALARALVELLSLPAEERQALGSAGLRYAQESESWEHNAAALRGVCSRVLGETKR
jgi:glycosyltransferase involved in cell wall biosynthesis